MYCRLQTLRRRKEGPSQTTSVMDGCGSTGQGFMILFKAEPREVAANNTAFGANKVVFNEVVATKFPFSKFANEQRNSTHRDPWSCNPHSDTVHRFNIHAGLGSSCPAGHRWLPCRPAFGAFGSSCDAPSWWVRSCRIGAMNGKCCGGPSWKSNFRWPKIWRSCPQVWPCTLFYWEGIGCMNYYYLDMYNISIGSVWFSNDILESFERSVGF